MTYSLHPTPWYTHVDVACLNMLLLLLLPPHCHHPADSVMVIQGAQGSFEVNMVVVEDGTTVPSVTNNRVYMDDMMEKAGVNTDNLYGFNPSAW